MKIFSNNDLAKIGKKMEKDGKYAWINSLHYELEFVKN